MQIATRDEAVLPQTFVDYEEAPREYFLNAVTTSKDERRKGGRGES